MRTSRISNMTGQFFGDDRKCVSISGAWTTYSMFYTWSNNIFPVVLEVWLFHSECFEFKSLAVMN